MEKWEVLYLPEAAETLETQLLKAYFTRNGLLLCNENRELPSLFSVGGDWDGIVRLIEQGTVFYSKLYKGRVTYLSGALYEQVKPYKQRPERLRPESAAIYEFLSSVGPVGTAEIKAALCLSGKSFSEHMDELFRELLVTAIERDRTISENWSSFRWGTFAMWERRHPLPGTPISKESLHQLLGPALTERQIQSLLR